MGSSDGFRRFHYPQRHPEARRCWSGRRTCISCVAGKSKCRSFALESAAQDDGLTGGCDQGARAWDHGMVFPPLNVILRHDVVGRAEGPAFRPFTTCSSGENHHNGEIFRYGLFVPVLGLPFCTFVGHQ